MSNNGETAKGLRLEQLFPLMEEKLKSGGEVTFKPHGTSMLPLIRQGKDSVTLSQITDEPKKLDVIFYRRADGQFVLHRIIGKNKKGFVLCGDNQTVKEYGVRKEQIIGIMTAVIRDGERVLCNRSDYVRYCKGLWLHRVKLRVCRFRKRVISKLKRMFIK